MQFATGTQIVLLFVVMTMHICKPRVLLDFKYFTQYAASFTVSIGLLVEGMHYGWSSTSVPKLTDPKSSVPVSKDDAKSITQMFTYGSITYELLSIADYPKLNQKASVMLSVVVMVFSWILLAASETAVVLMVARFLAGTGRGLVLQVSVNYICEIADPKKRGFLGSLVSIMMNLGMFIMYSFGPHINIIHSSIIGAAISLIELMAIKWVPESPYVLLLRGNTESARIVLKSLRKLWNVEMELDSIAEIVRLQDEENDSFWSVFTVQSNRKALIIIVVLNGFQILSGINIWIHQILKLSGGDPESYSLAMLTSLGSLISCSVAGVLLDILGRKIILIISFAISGLSLTILGIFIYLMDPTKINSQEFYVVALSCLTVYTMAYKMGIGMVPLLMSGELFPMNIKNISSSICGIMSIIFSFCSIYFMRFMQLQLGYYNFFGFYAIFCFAGIFFTYYFVPETKCKTLSEIQTQLKIKS